jgi:hypothetical protein
LPPAAYLWPFIFPKPGELRGPHRVRTPEGDDELPQWPTIRRGVQNLPREFGWTCE